jgi:hypothetical protein
MSKTNINIHYLYADTEIKTGKSMGKHWIAFSPVPKGVPSKAAWCGVSPADAKTARGLADWFNAFADAYDKKVPKS